MDEQTLQDTVAKAKEVFSQGQYKQAIAGFKDAHQAYLAQGDDYLAAEMANNLSVSYLQNKQNKAALEIVQGTELVFQQHNDFTKQAMALGNQGAALEALKRFDEAMAVYQEAADLLKGRDEEELRTYILKSLSVLHLRKGNQLQSLLSMQHSIDTLEKPTLWQRIYRWLLDIPFKLTGK